MNSKCVKLLRWSVDTKHSGTKKQNQNSRVEQIMPLKQVDQNNSLSNFTHPSIIRIKTVSV